jgi:hypothetical protein
MSTPSGQHTQQIPRICDQLGSLAASASILAARYGHVLWHVRISRNAPVLAGCSLTDRRVYAVSGDG